MIPPNISVVVPVSKDIKMAECLQGIDEAAEIIVVLNNNPSREVYEIAKSDPRCIPIVVPGEGCNLALVLNRGVAAARNNKVLIMNSDCIAPVGLIRKMSDLLDSYEVVKARVVFLHGTFLEYLVAETRYLFSHNFNDRRNIFGPGMAFKKEIIPKVGGYLFDEDIKWGEDGDLSRRIHKAGIAHIFTSEVLEHSPETIGHDLRVAGKIGRGTRIRDYKRGLSFSAGLGSVLKSTLFDEKFHLRMAFKQDGFWIAAYLILWKIYFLFGYGTLYRNVNIKDEGYGY